MASVKSKVPKLRFKGFSEEWQSLSFARALHEVKRPIKMQNDTDYQLITVKRRNEGIVSRGIFKGKDVLVKSQFEVKKGDYIISKRQVVHGANGILPETLDGSIVSNEYLVAKGTDKMDIQFFSILSSLPIMYKQFFLSSYGIDIEKLFFDVNDWKKRTVNVPILKEQTQIGHFFQKLDQVIEIQQNALTQAQNYKKAMLQKMFPQNGEKRPKRRFKGFSGDWVKVKFRDIFIYERPDNYLVSNTEYLDQGIPVLTANKSFILGFTDEKNIYDKGACIIFDDFTLDSKYVDFAYMVKSSAIKILTPTKGFDLKFAFERLNTEKIINDGHARHYISIVQPTITLVPSLKEQTQIGNFFQQLDKQITEQQNKLTHYQTLKKAMLQRLFI
ncbi:restriction endonuclease subunit S [Gilliamella sp. B2776]|uniref:restriction endonuclease subunit S n=1 Tax=unclassified Gilliamella TaxID=2685620 RepID=UPI00226A8412|nr:MULTISPECIES: restriction endonuclease subunit S [unclassified Gilliamella]MCX8650143.1 restriction endonuclease subunit S [Gilliamella sp. B2779]MCX8653510.1 restriction endonuclease subunit S [Gilliamella sp. B2737]MCX8691986.1 restriction endonuclease subunit S [Gilliamella sp. B2776]MCX8703144.1 restriction endonuclease subunit S [Gilliamella sp. B2781]WDM19773.1 restriction endonuclease subunit S [Gilliamella sp. B3022]